MALTREERTIVVNAVYGEMLDIQTARHLLENLQEEYFSENKPSKVNDYTFELIGETIYAASNLIFHALLSYAMTTGDDTIDGLEAITERAADAALALSADKVAQKAIDKYCHTKGHDRFMSDIKPLFSLPGKEMIAEVEKRMKEGEDT